MRRAVTDTRTAHPRPQPRHIDRPRVALVLVSTELHLDHDAEHRFSPIEQHDQIGAVLGWLYVGQIRRFDPHLAIGGELELRVPPNRLVAIVNTRRAISADTALRLARYFNTLRPATPAKLRTAAQRRSIAPPAASNY